MKRPELLAPAGNFDSLVAAIEAGCDAVYLSGKLYGARSFASNFSNEEIVQAVKYAHLYSVKIYVTINTLIYDDEVPNFVKYVEFLHTNDVDAVIIQDIGMFDLIRKLFPNLEIHISTQMHVHNLDGCKLVSELGAKRVVLARETPIELIKEIKHNCSIDLEVFIHGALCVSYSGQCLMSSLIGGRSGNRGTCAQCCRQPYDLYCNGEKINKTNYLLSTKDLNTLEHIGELIEADVDSLKIEGRMKRPEYVYFVVSLYRKAIDNYMLERKVKISDGDFYELKKLFNRKFTEGFIFHASNSSFVNSFRPNHLGVKIGKVVDTTGSSIKVRLTDTLRTKDGIRIIGKKDIGFAVQTMYKNAQRVNEAKSGETISIPLKETDLNGAFVHKTTDNYQLIKINNLINQRKRKINISMYFEAKVGDNIHLKVCDVDGHQVKVVSDYTVEKSKSMSLDKGNITKQLTKVGDTVYQVKEIQIKVTDDSFIPVKILNDLRRMAIKELSEERLYHYNVVKGKYSIDIPNFNREQKYVIYLEDDDTKVQDSLYDEIIVETGVDNYKNGRKKISRVNEFLRDEYSRLLVGELGSVYRYAKDLDVVTDFSFNVTNSYTVALLHSLGVRRVTLSLEMNEHQIQKLINNYHERYGKHPNLELIVDGYPEVMVMKYDLLDGTYQEGNKYYLVDKYNNLFRVKKKGLLTYIYHFKPIKRKAYKKFYDMGINCIRTCKYEKNFISHK